MADRRGWRRAIEFSAASIQQRGLCRFGILVRAGQLTVRRHLVHRVGQVMGNPFQQFLPGKAGLRR
jgi:hypothetical protein